MNPDTARRRYVLLIWIIIFSMEILWALFVHAASNTLLVQTATTLFDSERLILDMPKHANVFIPVFAIISLVLIAAAFVIQRRVFPLPMTFEGAAGVQQFQRWYVGQMLSYACTIPPGIFGFVMGVADEHTARSAFIAVSIVAMLFLRPPGKLFSKSSMTVKTDTKTMEHPAETQRTSWWLEQPWLNQQTQSHLVLGVFYKKIPLVWPLLLLVIISLVTQGVSAQGVGLLFALFFLFKLRREYQAIVGWLTTKGTLGLVAIMMATLGAGTSYVRGQSDFWPNLFLGLIWIPGPEFVKVLTPKQKWITLGRLVLSVPCIYFGVRSGFWH